MIFPYVFSYDFFFFLYVHACCKRLLFWLLKHCDYFCISLLELINFSFSALINYDLLLMDEYAVDCSIYLLSTLKVIQLIHFSLFIFFSHMCNGHNNSDKFLMLVIQITNVIFKRIYYIILCCCILFLFCFIFGVHFCFLMVL